MMTYSDNQTGHLFVLSNATSSPTVADTMVIGNTVDHLFNIKFGHKESSTFVTDEVSDNIDDRRILKIDVKAVTPVYFRKWVVKPITINDLPAQGEEKTFSLYFYLENMTGFGLQDRWDIVASYKATNSDTVTTVMTALTNELAEKISAAGTTGANAKFSPIANDFTVTMDTTTSSSTYCWITVAENSASPTYSHTDMEIMTNGAPYEYDLTLSTYDGNSTWGGNPRRIIAENTSTVRFKSGVVVKDMENFFMRNRKDLYSLSPNFGASIVNEGNADRDNYYSMVNVHYAYSDSLGFTYYSEKDLNIAVVEAAEGDTYNGTAFMNAILSKTADGKIAALEALTGDATKGNNALNTRVTTLEEA